MGAGDLALLVRARLREGGAGPEDPLERELCDGRESHLCGVAVFGERLVELHQEKATGRPFLRVALQDRVTRRAAAREEVHDKGVRGRGNSQEMAEQPRRLRIVEHRRTEEPLEVVLARSSSPEATLHEEASRPRADLRIVLCVDKVTTEHELPVPLPNALLAPPPASSERARPLSSRRSSRLSTDGCWRCVARSQPSFCCCHNSCCDRG